MAEIHVEKLIRAVKARPALYNIADAGYNYHNKYKGKIWKEVCKEVYPNWDQLRSSQQMVYDIELQKRWKSLRTCFTRELALQRKERTRQESNDPDEGPYKKRKKYEHFDALTFLLSPEDADIIESSGVDIDGESSDPLETEIKVENFLYQDNNDRSIRESVERNDEPSPAPYLREIERSYESQSRIVEEKILDLLREKKREEDDEDRQFMLSLVPGFKKLSDRQKYDAKIEILKVLKNITFQDDSNK